jgi:hypothetical protein
MFNNVESSKEVKKAEIGDLFKKFKLMAVTSLARRAGEKLQWNNNRWLDRIELETVVRRLVRQDLTTQKHNMLQLVQNNMSLFNQIKSSAGF